MMPIPIRRFVEYVMEQATSPLLTKRPPTRTPEPPWERNTVALWDATTWPPATNVTPLREIPR